MSAWSSGRGFSMSHRLRVAALLAGFSVVGFSGSRSVVPVWLPRVGAAVPVGVSVLVGCASGVDHAVSLACPTAQVFTASAFGVGSAGIVRRSVALAQQVAAVSGLLVAFPSGPCPVGVSPTVQPRTTFCSGGSGTWATVTLALGSGAAVLLWLPAHLSAPSWVSPLGGGWYFSGPLVSKLFV